MRDSNSRVLANLTPNSFFFSLSATFTSPLSPGRQLVWIVFFLISLPSIYLGYRMQHQVGENSKEGSDEERYELMGARRTGVDLQEGLDKRHDREVPRG